MVPRRIFSIEVVGLPEDITDVDLEKALKQGIEKIANGSVLLKAFIPKDVISVFGKLDVVTVKETY